MINPLEQHLEAFKNILQYLTNTFYRTEDQEEDIIVTLSYNGVGENYYNFKELVLSKALMESYHRHKIPRFVIYYHELGHHLYTREIKNFMYSWERSSWPKLQYFEKYFHLVNWIEDFYIEARLLKEHAYLTDVIRSIRRLPTDYPIEERKYSFNYWYAYGKPSPSLSTKEQKEFKNQLDLILTLRNKGKHSFNYGQITEFYVSKPTLATQYVLALKQFYAWCEAKKIFEKDTVLPPLQHPIHYIVTKDDNGTDDNGTDALGSSTKHTKTVGKYGRIAEVIPLPSNRTLFKEELVEEQRFIHRELMQQTEQLNVDHFTLDGLFTTRTTPSSLIQSQIILPNFFNPDRWIDQVLFRRKLHTYMNVAIYRDVSGSVKNTDIFPLIHQVCQQLHQDIPVDITYYLYASGPVSIIEVPYIPWDDHRKVPKEYKTNPQYQQLSAGTNSDAIADVITQQLSEKWLNIIVTDGDLNALLRRDNIYKLLSNVFVIAIQDSVPEKLHGITIHTKEDVPKINAVLSRINLEETR